jgi:FkbM family methyltransferase
MIIRKIHDAFALRSRCGLGFRDLWRLRRAGWHERYQAGKIRFFGADFSYVDATSLLAGLREIYIDECYKFKASNQEPRIIDCGANIGLSVFYFKHLYPLAKILAIEADPVICGKLRANVTSAAFSDVDVRNRAVWIANEPVEFRTEGGFSGRVTLPGDVASVIRVDGARLRDLLDEPVDLLKIDIEGAENQVIADCADRLRNVSSLFLEYHSHQHAPQQLDEILRALKDSGFRYYIREAFVPRHPLVRQYALDGMDLQLNIYGIRV